MSYEPWHKIRCYRVTAWEPPEEGAKSQYGKQHNFGVVATSATAAMAKINATHPRVRIDAVNETCIVHYIVDSPSDSAGVKPE